LHIFLYSRIGRINKKYYFVSAQNLAALYAIVGTAELYGFNVQGALDAIAHPEYLNYAPYS
jgi:hypothetical protein